jgi:hypothetical protein
MPEGHHPPLSRSSNVEHPRIVGFPLQLETSARSPPHPPSWSWRSRGGSPHLVKPAGELRSWIRDLFSVELPYEGAAGGWMPAAEQERGARGALARPCGECLPRGGGREGRWSADRALFRRNSCRGRAWGGLQRVFGASPLTATPLGNAVASRRSRPGGPVRPAAQAYR